MGGKVLVLGLKSCFLILYTMIGALATLTFGHLATTRMLKGKQGKSQLKVVTHTVPLKSKLTVSTRNSILEAIENRRLTIKDQDVRRTFRGSRSHFTLLYLIPRV